MLSPDSTRCNPLGPITIPDKIRPMIPGIRNFLKMIGATKIIVIRIVKTITGSLKGKSGKVRNDMPGLNLGFANVIQLDGNN